ncbi:nuclear RNA polymerase D1B [Artemisia annua]|uniref:DNA-directed RNA polymerase subunit n=1 Tax=Artemisia annua TaxID=35608 RepID=A0A2U1PD18_ARTAN|nr:nuclear RNA polymerase D1B [Artemisia annua]
MESLDDMAKNNGLDVIVVSENSPSTLLEGKITGVSFSLATTQEICLSSISDCPISHASQLSNPFLGLPLEVGKCEACGAAEPGKCEGHFGYIELPVPIYHPAHITELKRILSLICLKCLKYKNKRPQAKNIGVLERAFASCCEDAAQVTVNEAKTADGACYLELKVPSRSRREAIWDFLDRYGYHYGDGIARPLLPSEVLIILKKIPDATKKKLAGRGCFFQEGYIMQHLPVPPNCLSTPDVSDGINVMSSDNSMSMLKKVLRQVEIIKSSRSGHPNFESLEVEVNDLQAAVAQYLQSRGAKGSGFSSRSVITGDPYKGVGEIGIPFEIAQRITFEERVTEYNMKFLQKLVDHKLCLTYRDGQSTYSLREGSKGHTFLKPGQVVHRKIMEGDVIFINRPPTTHKHSLQALSVYIHEDHTFKINPLICGPLSADFDGDCIHIFYPQSPDAKAEVLELFAVEKQLLSSHSGHPLLMENLSKEGFNISLEDFIIPRHVLNNVDLELGDLSSLLRHLRKNYNEVIALQVDKRLRLQIGFLGLQILEKGRLYSRTLAEDLSAHFLGKYPFPDDYPYEEFGLVRNGLFHGLDPYQEMVHSICNREQMVRSSRGLTEPGTLFKNSMAILRDVVICYDGTVRNVCSNSIIQFEYGGLTHNFFAAGEPVGVLAATAMSNPAYKAVLDSSPNSNSSWDNMKEILFCGVNFKNVLNDRRVVLYLNACDCGGKYCLENAAYLVKNHLTKVSLKDVALEFLIEYDRKQVTVDNAIDAGLVGHVHLNKALLEQSKISMEEILTKCEDTLNSFRKKKKVGQLFKKIALDCSECSFNQSSKSNWTPCLKFFWQDTPDIHLENTARIFADTFCPVLLNAIIKGDPRVKEANITWISPETTGWIGNPSKEQKGELAINVVLEKEAVKKNGDAWRTVMDSCLPIIHLIDTTRSIPYAIKQVENLLGIACTFEQAIQRLSTSVSMVTKGMLKEHLLLLASSMTCAGILVGFNQAGIKALSKALNFQAPFSEATTPKKCFEKAAEKCHADSLSSIVGACSWGKPVAVGTGSRFDILWDTREVELNQKDGIDVYNFLNLVRGVSEEEADNECLGGELDSFDLEDNYMETGSPEIESGSAKPVFEDGLDLNIDEMDVDRTGGKSTWETGPISEDGGGWGGAVKTSATNEGGWGEAAKSDKDQQETGSWGGWGANKSQEDVTEPSESWGKKKDDVAAAAHVSGWGAKKPDTDTSTEKGSSWGQKVSKADGVGWGSKKSDDAKRGLGLGSGSWGQKVVSENEAGWGAKKSEIETVKGSGSGSWGQKADEAGWGSKKSDDTERALGLGSGSWGQKVVGGNEAGWGAKKSVTENEKGSGSGSWGQKAAGGNDWGAKRSENEAGWGAKIPDNETEKGSESGSWGGQKAASKNESGWGVKRSETEAGWGAKKPENETEKGSRSGSWGQKVVKPSQPQAEISNDSDQWGSKESWKAQTGSSTAWGKRAEDKPDAPTWNQGQKTVEKVQPWASWGKKDDTAAAQVEDSSQWGKKDSRKEDVGSSASSWGKPADAPSWNTGAKLQVDVPSSDEPHKPEGSDWSKKVEEKTESKGGWGDSWGKKKEDQTGTTQGANDETTDKGSNWGWNRKEEQKQDQGGWKKKEGWGPKRDRPFRPVGGPNDGPRPGGPFTATGQRIDMFTADEQEILAAVEPIALSIRRIMNGYNDGDPLSADDQTYILDNVFCYHPFKAQKMGAGVKHFMVNKHTKFQESRCLFVVSTDDREEDFSYRKCLENFVKAKFPDKVDEFWPKYLKKSQPRPSINRDNRVSGPDEGGTPRSQSGWKRDTNDESGTPRSQSGWKRDTNDESGTPRSQSGWKRDTNDESSTPRSQSGWNCESSVATDETGPPAATGWNKESSTAPEVGGAPATGWNQVGSSSGAAAEGGNSKSGWGS